VVFDESTPLINILVKLSNFYGHLIAMSQMSWKNYFAQPIMKVISKRKTFKTNNSSGVLYGLHLSNGPTTRRGEEMP